MTTTADLDLVAPGWHRDPGNPRHITYWNGARWTVHMRWHGADWQRCQEPHDPPPVPTAALAHMVIGDMAPAAPVTVDASASVGTTEPAPFTVTEPEAAPTDTLGPAGPNGRRRRRLYGLLALLVLAAAAGGGYFVLRHRSAAPSATTPPVATSAALLLGDSLSAARSQASVHLVSSESAGGAAVSSTSDLTSRLGQQTIVGGSAGNATAVAMPGAAYLKADAAFLEGSLGISPAAAARAAGTWVEFRPSDTGYGQVASGVTLGSALAYATPSGTLRRTAPTVVQGQRVVGIAGGLPRGSAAGAVGQQVLYVEAAAPHLPVELDITGSLDGRSGTSTVTFSAWHEPVTAVTVPPSATPASALGS